MKEFIKRAVPCLFIFLFAYTAYAKITDHATFAGALSRSVLVADYAGLVAWLVPAAEIAAMILLIVPLTQRAGLYASLLLMMVFTWYLAYMLLSGSRLLCECGGVISGMSWRQHLTFNTVFILMAVAGILADSGSGKIYSNGTNSTNNSNSSLKFQTKKA